MKRRHFLMGAGALAAAGTGGVMWARRDAPRPRADIRANSGLNILFVMSDQERSWDQYPAGFIEAHCPARSWLTEHGVSVATAYTPTQLCSTARGVVYSGQHSMNNGIWDNAPVPYSTPMSKSIPTMGSLFQDAGYKTGYAGKWHLSKIERMPHGQPIIDEIRSYGFDETEAGTETDGPHVGYQHDGRTVRHALSFIERNKRSAKNDQPWMLAVNLLNPHDVMYYTSGPAMTASRKVNFPDRSTRPPDDPFYARDLGYDIIGPWGPATLAGRPAGVREFKGAMDNTLGTLDYDDPAIARDFQNYYWNCTRDCDRHLMTLLDGLRAAGELERTVIVFTSDHGEMLGAHGMRGKGVNGYREASQIPLVVVHPDGDKGVERQAMASQIDLVPTLLGYAGVDTATLKTQLPEVVGHDIGTLAASSQPTNRDTAGILQHFTSMAFQDEDGGEKFKDVWHAKGPRKLIEGLQALPRIDWDNRGQMRGFTDGRVKFARYFAPDSHNTPTTWEALTADNDIEFYDLTADPGERVNRADDPAAKDAVLAANARLNTLLAEEVGVDDGGFLPPFVKL